MPQQQMHFYRIGPLGRGMPIPLDALIGQDLSQVQTQRVQQGRDADVSTSLYSTSQG